MGCVIHKFHVAKIWKMWRHEELFVMIRYRTCNFSIVYHSLLLFHFLISFSWNHGWSNLPWSEVVANEWTSDWRWRKKRSNTNSVADIIDLSISLKQDGRLSTWKIEKHFHGLLWNLQRALTLGKFNKKSRFQKSHEFAKVKSQYKFNIQLTSKHFKSHRLVHVQKRK